MHRSPDPPPHLLQGPPTLSGFLRLLDLAQTWFSPGDPSLAGAAGSGKSDQSSKLLITDSYISMRACLCSFSLRSKAATATAVLMSRLNRSGTVFATTKHWEQAAAQMENVFPFYGVEQVRTNSTKKGEKKPGCRTVRTNWTRAYLGLCFSGGWFRVTPISTPLAPFPNRPMRAKGREQQAKKKDAAAMHEGHGGQCCVGANYLIHLINPI